MAPTVVTESKAFICARKSHTTGNLDFTYAITASIISMIYR